MKLKITKEDKQEFKSTANGAKKAIWMLVGMMIDFLATLGISFLNIFSSKLPSVIYFYVLLFILLVIVVLGGEMIGVYFGALEQYVYNKHTHADTNMESNKKILKEEE